MDVKIGTKEEKAWKEIKEKSESEIDACKRLIEINKAIVDLAAKKIKQEQKV